MKAIIAQMKSYYNEQKGKRIFFKEMNAPEALEGREGNVSDVSNKIDLVMAADTNESNKINMTMSHVLTVMTLQKKVQK